MKSKKEETKTESKLLDVPLIGFARWVDGKKVVVEAKDLDEANEKFLSINKK